MKKTEAGAKIQKAQGWFLAFVLCLLPACSFTFLPFAPRPLAIPPAIIVGNDSSLGRSRDTVVLRVRLVKVPSEGYLSASLYLKTNRTERRIGEDSKLIAPDSSRLEFVFPEAKTGEYRAYLFWQGNIVRQFEFRLE
jgi:hypothetical protein